MRTFEIEIKESPHSLRIVRIDAPDVMAALHKLHRQLQGKENLDADGYVVSGISHLYNGAVNGVDMMRSPYPVPGGPNPNLRKPA